MSKVNVAQHMLVFGVRLYQGVISPVQHLLFGPLARCRFTPSCSEYARQAVCRHGAWAGSWLALKRIARCQPWGGWGPDPVPRHGKFETQNSKSEAVRQSQGL